jgi:hypothetical protein
MQLRKYSLYAMEGGVDTQLVLFSDEAWFSLCGEVNSQNSRYWSAENPGLTHELYVSQCLTLT